MSICALLPVTGMGGGAEHESQPKQQKHSQNSMDCNAGHGYIPSLEVLESYKEILGEISKNRVNADHIYLNPRTWPACGMSPKANLEYSGTIWRSKVSDASFPPEITFEEFLKVDIRVGVIVRAEPFPEARKPSIKLWIDFGAGIGVKKSSAQIAVHYTPEELIGRQVAAVINFPPRQIGPMMSEVLTLGFPDENGEVVLFAPDLKVPLGARLF